MSNEKEAELYAETIRSSVSRSRNFLIVLTLASAWILAVHIQQLFKWEPIRTAVTSNLAFNIDRYLIGPRALDTPFVRVPFKHIRNSDFASELDIKDVGLAISKPPTKSKGAKDTLKEKKEARPDTSENRIVRVKYPIGRALAEQADWCKCYEFYVAQQWPLDSFHLVELMVERAEIAGTILPKSSIHVPTISFPILNVDMDFNDVAMFGAITLLCGFIWFYLALIQLNDSVERFEEAMRHYGDAERRMWYEWLALQFLFYKKSNRTPARLSYPLVFLPYITVVFTLLQFLNTMYFEIRKYDILTGGSFSPLGGKLRAIFQEPVGTIILRLLVHALAALILGVAAQRCWALFRSIGGRLNKPDEAPGSRMDPADAKRLIMITAVPVALFAAWAIGEGVGIEDRVKVMGWTYGIPFIAVFIVGAGIIVAGLLIYGIWRTFGEETVGKN